VRQEWTLRGDAAINAVVAGLTLRHAKLASEIEEAAADHNWSALRNLMAELDHVIGLIKEARDAR
jgi:hypothetical protein